MLAKIAINASNIHGGGALQAATSFLDEISRIEICDLEMHFFVSSEVDFSLRKINSPCLMSDCYKVINTKGLLAYFSSLNHELSKFHLIFTVFGPSYLRAKQPLNIVGFAQPWIIDNSAYKILGVFIRPILKAKFFLQSFFFKRADKLVVELDHVKKRIAAMKIKEERNVEVVHNCISSIFYSSKHWEPISVKLASENFLIGFLGRDYPHKNTEFLPAVKDILMDKYGIAVDFCVTMNKREWSVKSKVFKSKIFNVGSLSITQCPSFYELLDAVIFPSILECFSATPLEALAMKKPLFASNRDFVRDICGNHAFYFDPFDPNSAAEVIACYINELRHRDDRRLELAREHALKFSDPRTRAERYLEIIRNTLNDHNHLVTKG